MVLAEALSAHVELEPNILNGYPLLSALLETILQLPGIAAYIASAQRWPLADEAYVINVAQVLRRALPPHMPNADRFARSQ